MTSPVMSFSFMKRSFFHIQNKGREKGPSQSWHFKASLTGRRGKTMMKSRTTFHPVKFHSESFLRSWTVFILIISLIYHRKASEMTWVGPRNGVPERSGTISQENEEVLWSGRAPENQPATCCSFPTTTACQRAEMKTRRADYNIT